MAASFAMACFVAWFVSEKLGGKAVPAQLLTRWLRDEELAAADANISHVLGIVHLEADFAYDASIILTTGQDTQRMYWKSLDIQDASLWFYKIRSAACFPEPLPARQALRHGAVQVYDVVSEDIGAELCLNLEPLPDWFPANGHSRLVISVPARFATLFTSNRWCQLALPSPFAQGPWRVAAWKLRVMGPLFIDAFQDRLAVQAGEAVDELNLTSLFSLADCQDLADDLRGLMSKVPEEDRGMLCSWVRQLQNTHDDISLPAAAKSAKFHRLIDFVFLCETLRSVRHAKESIVKALEMTLPESLLKVAKQQLAQQRMYDKSQISRFRVVLDAAFMVWRRSNSWQQLQRQGAASRTHRYLMWDASPQFSREYEMIRVISIPEQESPDLYHSFLEMSSLWLNDAGDLDDQKLQDQTIAETEVKLMQRLSPVCTPHIYPSVLLAFGGTTLAHKFHALMHAFRLEVFTNKALATLCSELTSVTADFGVEHMLGQIGAVPVSSICQWFSDTDDATISRIVHSVLALERDGSAAAFEDPNVAASNPHDLVNLAPDVGGLGVGDVGLDEVDLNIDPVPLDVDADAAPAPAQAIVFEEPPPEPCIDLAAMLSIPGIHHVVDNAVNGLDAAMESYSHFLKLSVSVCKFLRRSASREVLIARCFSSPVGLQFVEGIKNFKGAVFPGRWGTIAFSIPHLLAVERGLRWGWDKGRFLRDEAGNVQSSSSLVDEVDEALSSPVWWAWLRMLELLVSILRHAIGWVETCPCHGGISRLQGVPEATRSRWRKCPMRGLRAAELCNGELLRNNFQPT